MLEVTVLLKGIQDPYLQLASVELDKIICWISTTV